MIFVLSVLTQYLFSYQQSFFPSGDRKLHSGDSVWVSFCLAANTYRGILASVCSLLFLVHKEDGVGAGGLLETLNFQHTKKMPPQATFI